ncbi:MAG: dephospho-CoA kinase [Oscillospiraceae bacterium]|nr:dephospho-CoA kinase [Oscillospiraceae bacterium]
MKSFNELNIIGLTGMSGAGKSLAARVFAENGFCAIDCDMEARRVIQSEKCAEAVKNAFPEAYTNNEFDRVKMARLVFSDSAKLKEYERIIFPFIIYEIVNLIQREAEKGEKNFLLDAPTLYQGGADDFCGKIVAVVADKTACIQRITARDNISEADALLRLNSQPSADFYKEKADYFIENNSDTESFLKAVKRVIEDIK